MEKLDTAMLTLPEEREYPEEIREQYELMEMFSENHDTRTLLGKDRKSGTPVTIKCFIRPHPLYDQTEPEALRRLNVPPMPRFLGEYRNDGMRCVVRQYVAGDTLEQYAGRKPFSEERTRVIGEALCDQLRELHRLSPPIIHRDVKPQNIVIQEDGTPVLIDFGIARVRSEGEKDTAILGTQGFAPPEQYGFSQTDARSDLYSLGMVLHWMLTGETEPPREAKTPLEKVIRKMTSFDPEKRYAGAAQAKRALSGTEPKRRKRRALSLAAAVLMLAGLGTGILLAVRSGPKKAVFSSPLVEEAVRLNLGLAENESVTEDMLSGVRGVFIVADRAYPGPDEFYAAINDWYAGGKAVRGEMEDLEDLRLLPQAETVGVVAQQLSDISALAEMKALKTVELKHNYIRDISVLAGMDRLTAVGINDNPVTDISPLTECPNLAFLDLCDVRTYDAAVIERLGNFSYLDVSNPTESYRHLGGKSVLSLRLGWTGLTNLTDLDGVTRLEDLDISHTAVSDLSPITVHSGLKRLKIAADPIGDLSPLLKLPLLETLTISRDMAPQAEALGDVSFTILYE